MTIDELGLDELSSMPSISTFSVPDGINKSPCQTESVKMSLLMLAQPLKPGRKDFITS